MEGVKTKSGRKVHRPAPFNPAQKAPSRRRGPYRRNYDARICKVCQRGHSPQSNMIVFCDGCNVPFHQLCHDPPIDDLVIAVESAEWYCAGCSKLREQKPLSMGLTGSTLTEEEKRKYLNTLPLNSLVEIILYAEKVHPDLAIYDPDTKDIVSKLQPGRDWMEDGIPVTGKGAKAAPVDRLGPHWEEMIARAIAAVGEGKGVQPKHFFSWMEAYEIFLNLSDIYFSYIILQELSCP
jgi:hypothetical protein